MFIINIVKKSLSHLRKSVKITIIMVIAGVMLTGLALYIYKPTYSVTLNNEFIGYTQNKSQLQLRINEAMRKGDGENIAFMQIDNMPEYNLCLLKRDVETTKKYTTK